VGVCWETLTPSEPLSRARERGPYLGAVIVALTLLNLKPSKSWVYYEAEKG
jgi:hypothetical protein